TSVAAIERVVPAVDGGASVAVKMLVIAASVRRPVEALVSVARIQPIVEVAIEAVPAPARIVRGQPDLILEAGDGELRVARFPGADPVQPDLEPARLLAQLPRFLAAERVALPQHRDPEVDAREARSEHRHEIAPLMGA